MQFPIISSAEASIQDNRGIIIVLLFLITAQRKVTEYPQIACLFPCHHATTEQGCEGQSEFWWKDV